MEDKRYLITECTPLNDDYECDCDRQIIKMVNDYSEYKNRYGYEVYECLNNGELKIIQNYYDGKVENNTDTNEKFDFSNLFCEY